MIRVFAGREKISSSAVADNANNTTTNSDKKKARRIFMTIASRILLYNCIVSHYSRFVKVENNKRSKNGCLLSQHML